MTYQVSTLEYTVPNIHNERGISEGEKKHTATVIKAVGNINLKEIILPMDNGAEVYIENNKNQWIFMNINAEPEDNYAAAYCVNSELEVWWYDLIDKRNVEGEDYDEQGAPEMVRELSYLKAQLRG